MEPIKVVKCQHCQRKVVMKLPRDILFAACPRCGLQTETRPKRPSDEQDAPRPIADPSIYV